MTYPTAVLELLTPRLSPLGPGTPNAGMKAKLASFRLVGPVVDARMAKAVHSALWLYHDFLDESHTISQDLDTPTGSFLHAVMHRREPDAWNSKYWWRRVGSHPIFPQLAVAAADLSYGSASAWDPAAFVDACEADRDSGSPREELLKQVQRTEWELLFAYCYREATGEPPAHPAGSPRASFSK